MEKAVSVCVEILIVGDLTVESALVPSLLKKWRWLRSSKPVTLVINALMERTLQKAPRCYFLLTLVPPVVNIFLPRREGSR